MSKEYIKMIEERLLEMRKKASLDPVGKADADIDNDGDVDASDEYLKKRRAAIKKSMKKEDDDQMTPCPKCDGSMENHDPECPNNPDNKGKSDAEEGCGNYDKKMKKEEVEMNEAADLMKMSKELLKHKDKGVNYEKAAAYVRAIHNNSAVSVQDKAMKGLLDLLKNMDLTDRTTITKILKDNGFKVKGGRVMREEVELDEALQHVHTIKIDGNAPNNPKPFEVREIKDDFKTHVQAVRSAIKSKGGLVTDTETPSKSNNYVGRIMVGTRGDASKIDTKSIEKAVKRHGVEIHDYQFESVELDENYRTLATHGMGAETKNTINVGRDVDYYEPKNGDKRQGRITKIHATGYHVKDEKDGKTHSFTFHDRAKAKKMLESNQPVVSEQWGFGEVIETTEEGLNVYFEHGVEFNVPAEDLTFVGEAADRAKHYKGAAKPETMLDKFKGAGAKKMATDNNVESPKEADITPEEKGHEDATKAGRAVSKQSPTRRGEPRKGDISIVNPVKGAVTKTTGKE